MMKHKRITPEIDEQIARVYREKVGLSRWVNNAPVRELSERIGIPRWKISRRAVTLGFISKTRKEPDWSEEEISLLEKNAWKSIDVIYKIFRNAGYSRTPVSIQVKRKRLHCLSGVDGISANSLAECFGIDRHAIMKWIDKGWLKAKRRGTDRAGNVDIYYIKPKDIREFVIGHVAILDFRKVDKYWLVDLLTNKTAE